jgi:hypothetical protein
VYFRLKTQGPLRNDLRASVDWVVISALLCALGALGALGWYFWQNHNTGEPLEMALTLEGTGDAALDRALELVLRLDLEQSPFLTVMPPGEVCKRASAQVMLTAAVSRIGQHYQVRLLASHCAPGSAPVSNAAPAVLAQAKEEVQRLDDLPRALGALAAEIRRSVGESRASLRRFDQPLRAADPRSLEALKAYSEAHRLATVADWSGTLPWLRHAVELDPQFGLAYVDMATSYANLGDKQKERAALTKAYALRDSVPEMKRLLITALYYDTVTGDTAKSIETYQAWTTLYPHSADALDGIADEYDLTGRASLGVAAARRAAELRPNDMAPYVSLARTELHSGQVEAAQHACELALGKKLDSAEIRHLLLQALFVRNDLAGVAIQLDWGRTHPEALVLHLDEIRIALTRGQIHRATDLLARLRGHEYPSALAAQYQSGLVAMARALAEGGLTSESQELLKSVSSASQDGNGPVALAENGDVKSSAEALEHLGQTHGQETLWKSERLPEIQAALLLAKHQPRDAVNALDPTLPFEGGSFGPAYLRGEAWWTLGKPGLAQVEFLKITEHRYIDPLSNEYPLALLASARAYALQNQLDPAHTQIERLLDTWKDADADWPLLQAARAEYDSETAVGVSLKPD